MIRLLSLLSSSSSSRSMSSAALLLLVALLALGARAQSTGSCDDSGPAVDFQIPTYVFQAVTFTRDPPLVSSGFFFRDHDLVRDVDGDKVLGSLAFKAQTWPEDVTLRIGGVPTPDQTPLFMAVAALGGVEIVSPILDLSLTNNENGTDYVNEESPVELCLLSIFSCDSQRGEDECLAEITSDNQVNCLDHADIQGRRPGSTDWVQCGRVSVPGRRYAFVRGAGVESRRSTQIEYPAPLLPTPAPVGSRSTGDDDSSVPVGAIIGGAVGAAAVLALIIIVCVYVRSLQEAKKQEEELQQGGVLMQ